MRPDNNLLRDAYELERGDRVWVIAVTAALVATYCLFGYFNFGMPV